MVDAHETHGRGRLVNEFILRNFSQRELCHASWELGGKKDVKSRTGLKWGWQWLLGQLPQIIFLENVIRAPSEPARVISYVEINLLSFSPVKFIIHPWSEIKRNSSQKRVRRKDENKWMGSALDSCEVANYAFYNSSPFFFFFWVNYFFFKLHFKSPSRSVLRNYWPNNPWCFSAMVEFRKHFLHFISWYSFPERQVPTDICRSYYRIFLIYLRVH